MTVERSVLLEEFHKWIVFVDLLTQHGEELWNRNLQEGKWSIREIVSHIMLWDKYYLEEGIEKIFRKMPLTVQHLDFDEFNEKANVYGLMTHIDEISSQAVYYREHIINHIKSLSDEEYLTTYTERGLLLLFLKQGILALITGASKSGKTVLCHSVIDNDKLVEISGSHIRNPEDLWVQIAEKLQIPIEVETTLQQSNEMNVSGEAGGKAGIPLIAGLALKGTAGTKFITSEAIKDKQQRSKNHMIDDMIRDQKVLVIDDFHYISTEIQKYISRVLST